MAPERQRTEPGAGGMFRRVLVGFDGSAEAQRALRVAVALAADLQGEAHVLLVVRLPAHTETPADRLRAAEAARENLSRGLSELLARSRGEPDVSTEVVHADDPGVAIAEYAEEHGFDLVVVGEHGREQSTHRGIGQSVETLLRHHPCPVLVV